MNAWEIQRDGGINALVPVERAKPSPGARELVVRVRAVSLNYRDLLHVLGYVDRDKWPLVPCSDGAGEVVAVGRDVTRYKIGDRVAGTFFQGWDSGPISAEVMETALGGRVQGLLAQHALLSEDGAVPVIDFYSFEQAATLPCAALTAWNALVTQGRLAAGESVLLLGTGGVSLFALQIARMHGARVILTSSSDEKLERARQLGAHETINYRSCPDWESRVLALTGGCGVDHVVEVGGAGTLEKSCLATRHGGHVWLIGVLTGFAATVNPLQMLQRSLRVQGIYVGSAAMFRAMNAAFATNRLQPVIDQTFAFKAAPGAFQCMQDAGHFGKIVVTVE